MKLYMAATAPGNEKIHKHGFIILPNRLLSYYLIIAKKFESDQVLDKIKTYKTKQHGNKKN